MMSRKKLGRPTLPTRELRNKRVVTFVTEQEMRGLERIAADEDRSLSALLHRLVVDRLREDNTG